MMKFATLFLVVVGDLFAITDQVAAFAPPSSSLITSSSVAQQQKYNRPSSSCRDEGGSSSSTALLAEVVQESEAERLLKRAKALREQAAAAENEVHSTLAKKKEQQDSQMDQWIDQLFFSSSSSLLDQLRKKRPCMDTLYQIVERIDERQMIAEGTNEHVVQAKGESSSSLFQRVIHPRNEQELEKLNGLLDNLFETMKVLDDEFVQTKEQSQGGTRHVSHTEETHFGGGHCAERLENHYHEITRAREEQYIKRQESFREAQRIKKDRPAPPKAKDDHRYLP